MRGASSEPRATPSSAPALSLRRAFSSSTAHSRPGVASARATACSARAVGVRWLPGVLPRSRTASTAATVRSARAASPRRAPPPIRVRRSRRVVRAVVALAGAEAVEPVGAEAGPLGEGPRRLGARIVGQGESGRPRVQPAGALRRRRAGGAPALGVALAAADHGDARRGEAGAGVEEGERPGLARHLAVGHGPRARRPPAPRRPRRPARSAGRRPRAPRPPGDRSRRSAGRRTS